MAGRMSRLRLTRNWKRETLAERAGVSANTIKRFESTGHITLESLLKLALALGCLEQFESLFVAPPFNALAELERQVEAEPRRRGRK